jgi:hypothetical protein
MEMTMKFKEIKPNVAHILIGLLGNAIIYDLVMEWLL